MKVKVYPPSAFCDASAINEDNYMELPEQATLKDVYKGLKIPLIMHRVLFCNVNFKREKLNKVLQDDDTITFFSPVAGG